MNTIRRGSMGSNVLAWLQVLAKFQQPTTWTNSKGEQRGWTTEMTWPLPMQFVFDKNTEAATEAWQAAHGLVADGIVGKLTWAAAGADVPPVSPEAYPLVKGTDTSVIQGKLPLKAMVADDIVFGWARCKVGNNNGRDLVFEQTMRGYADVGIMRGGYNFPFPLPHLKPEEQAKFFLDALVVDGEIVGTKPGELPQAFDLEWPPPEEWAKWKCEPNQLVDWALACLEVLETQSGVRPVIYSYPYFIQSIAKATNFSKLMKYRLWLAGGSLYLKNDGQWPNLETYRIPPVHGWGDDWLFNQWDGNFGKRLPGSNVDADFNIFRYDLETLRAFCRVVPAHVPEIEVAPDFGVIFHQSMNLLMEDALHQHRQERASAFLAQPV